MATSKYDIALKKQARGLSKFLKKKEDKIFNIVDSFLTSPQNSPGYWRSVRASLDREYKEVAKVYAEWSKKNYPKFYDSVVLEQMKRAANLKAVTRKAKKSADQLLKTNYSKQTKLSLTQSAIQDVNSGLALGKASILRLTRMTQQALLRESVIDLTVVDAVESGNLAVNKILSKQGTLANQLQKKVQGKRFITIIDRNGSPRNYRITTYAETVTRTKWHEAQSNAVLATANNYDTDLIRVSSHNTTTAICQQYEGKIYSISGKSRDFETFQQAPPFHPNCLHYTTVVFRESLEISGTYKDASNFSLGNSKRPPGNPTFVPVNKRAGLVSKETAGLKASDRYKESTTKQKAKLLSLAKSKAMADEAKRQVA